VKAEPLGEDEPELEESSGAEAEAGESTGDLFEWLHSIFTLPSGEKKPLESFGTNTQVQVLERRIQEFKRKIYQFEMYKIPRAELKASQKAADAREINRKVYEIIVHDAPGRPRVRNPETRLGEGHYLDNIDLIAGTFDFETAAGDAAREVEALRRELRWQVRGLQEDQQLLAKLLEPEPPAQSGSNPEAVEPPMDDERLDDEALERLIR